MERIPPLKSRLYRTIPVSIASSWLKMLPFRTLMETPLPVSPKLSLRRMAILVLLLLLLLSVKMSFLVLEDY